MFFSYNMVVMCLVFTLLFYLSWGGILYERIPGKEKLREEFYLTLKNLAFIHRTPTRLLFVLLAFVVGFAYYFSFHLIPELYFTGFSGLVTGFVWGGLINLVVVGIRFFIREMSEGLFKFCWVIGVIIIFSMMPWITEDLAKAQAKCDEYSFQDVKIISNENLHCEMQSATSNLTDCIDGKLIIINDGMAYVMKLIRTAPDTDCRDISLSALAPKTYLPVSTIRKSIDEYTFCQLVYAIPMESVRDIIYYSQK
jgi:hypothetical protein